MPKETFRPGSILSGQVFTLDEHTLSYKNAYGKMATVPRSAIQTVVIDTKGRGKSILKIIGQGTELAKIELPNPWATKTQAWLIEKLGL
jgi:hypothetical protein